eukprot:1195795-Rhodomonas_salina.4
MAVRHQPPVLDCHDIAMCGANAHRALICCDARCEVQMESLSGVSGTGSGRIPRSGQLKL